jgi:Ca-activated chloride channel family protein
MVPALWEALSTSPAENRLRIVIFMTDGLVGNDFEIISMIKKLRDKSRWFSFGTGNSVNRFLLDNVARVGGGEVDYVLLNSPAEAVAKKFHERIAAPVLTDISLSAAGVALEEVYPKVVSDLWSHKPLIFKARYSKPGEGTVKVKGFSGGKSYENTLKIKLPEKESANSSLKSLWARAKVDDLGDQDLMGIQRGNPDKGVKEEIVKVALSHKIMTQFTSFVAVEDTLVTMDGKPVKVTVPVEMPEGISREGVFGEQGYATVALPSVPKARNMPMKGDSAPPRGTAAGNLKTKQSLSTVAMREMPGSVPPAMPDSAEGATERRQERSDLLASKFPPELLELVRMKEKPQNYSKGKLTVKNSEVAVQVWINRPGDEILKLLQAKGLKITFKASTGKMVAGVISIERLEDLATIPEVRFVEPFVVTG